MVKTLLVLTLGVDYDIPLDNLLAPFTFYTDAMSRFSRNLSGRKVLEVSIFAFNENWTTDQGLAYLGENQYNRPLACDLAHIAKDNSMQLVTLLGEHRVLVALCEPAAITGSVKVLPYLWQPAAHRSIHASSVVGTWPKEFLFFGVRIIQ